MAILSIAVSILIKAEVAFEELDTEIIDPGVEALLEACAWNPSSPTSSPEILTISPAVWVRSIWPLNVTELPTEIVAPVASVWPSKKTPGVPAWAIRMSAPLALASWTSPLELAVATISPIEALLIAVIVSVSLVTLEKFIAFPLILILEAAVEASEKFKSSVTKLSPEAVTLVDDETALISIAL